MTRYVKTAYAGCPYITAGKVYEAFGWQEPDADGDYFDLVNDDGEQWGFYFNNSLNLDGHDWTECTADGTPIDGDGVARDARSVSSPEAAGRDDLDAGRELVRQCWRILNAIRARDGAAYGFSPDYWDSLTEDLGNLLGDDCQPWMIGAAKLAHDRSFTAGHADGRYMAAFEAEQAQADRSESEDRSESDSGASTITALREALWEMVVSLQAALHWIDAVPRETVLPAMPGFDRDTVNVTATKARELLK